MIVVVANLTLKEGAGDEFVKYANLCIAESTKEEGNISYRLLAATDAPDQYSFVEEWKSGEALQEHRKTPHYAQFNKDAGSLLAAPPQLNIYKAEKQG